MIYPFKTYLDEDVSCCLCDKNYLDHDETQCDKTITFALQAFKMDGDRSLYYCMRCRYADADQSTIHSWREENAEEIEAENWLRGLRYEENEVKPADILSPNRYIRKIAEKIAKDEATKD